MDIRDGQISAQTQGNELRINETDVGNDVPADGGSHNAQNHTLDPENDTQESKLIRYRPRINA